MPGNAFEVRDGCWYFRGKPVMLTTAWRWPQEDYGAEENMEHLRTAARDGFTSADLWFRGRDLWDGSGWTRFEGADRYVEEAASLGLIVVVTIDYTASRMPEDLIRKYGWEVVTEEGEELWTPTSRTATCSKTSRSATPRSLRWRSSSCRRS